MDEIFSFGDVMLTQVQLNGLNLDYANLKIFKYCQKYAKFKNNLWVVIDFIL